MSYYHGDNGFVDFCAAWIVVIGAFVLGILLACIWGLIIAFPEMWLWNWLVPKLFNGPEIGYWQMFGLHILSTLLLSRSTTVNNKSK